MRFLFMTPYPAVPVTADDLKVTTLLAWLIKAFRTLFCGFPNRGNQPEAPSTHRGTH